MDLLHWLLLSSDPVVTETRGWLKKSNQKFTVEAVSLLADSDTDSDDSHSDSSL